MSAPPPNSCSLASWKLGLKMPHTSCNPPGSQPSAPASRRRRVITKARYENGRAPEPCFNNFQKADLRSIFLWQGDCPLTGSFTRIGFEHGAHERPPSKNVPSGLELKKPWTSFEAFGGVQRPPRATKGFLEKRIALVGYHVTALLYLPWKADGFSRNTN